MASELHFKYDNSNATPSPPTSTSFQLTAQASTDIWCKLGSSEPGINRFDAPILYKPLSPSSFKSVRVTVSATWSAQYDQGGLIFVFPQSDGTKKWIKTGIELYMGQAFVSVVSKDRASDMSLVQIGVRGGNEVTLEAKRENDALWIYVVDGENKVPIREVTWAFCDTEVKECWVGVFAARPDKGTTQELVVDFEGFELDIV